MLTNNGPADRGFVKTEPVENPRIAALKAALAALTYSDMMGAASNIQVRLPTPTKPALTDLAAALSRYANEK